MGRIAREASRLKALGAQRRRWAYLMILPSFLLIFSFYILPVLGTGLISFLEYLPWQTRWVGLSNFRKVLSDPLFAIALRNTAIYTAAVVTFWLGKALLIAYLLDPLSPRLQTFLKGAFYLPGVTSGVIISLVWLWIYNPTFGFLNAFLRMLGLPPVVWLGNRSTALAAIIAQYIIIGGGSTIVLIAAALARIPNELYESALLDGSSRWRIFREISLPLIKPVLLYLVIMGTVNSFRVFDSIYVMTGGGPQFATTTIVYRIYETAFVRFRMGEASALSIVLFLILVVLAAVQMRWLSSEVEY